MKDADKRTPGLPGQARKEEAGKEKRAVPPEHGRFYMVAALGVGKDPLSEAEERALKPHARHKRHQAALREAHRLAGLHGRAFAVLSSGSVVHPPAARPSGEDAPGGPEGSGPESFGAKDAEAEEA